MEEMEKVADIKFYAPLMLDSSTTHIIRNNVIINICKWNTKDSSKFDKKKMFLDKNADKSSRSPDVIDDYVEIVILGPDNTYSKKQYNTWEIFMSDITCMYLFGNTFVIGTSCGTVSIDILRIW